MKKIVALVLSLVMVLGLATTAFAASPAYYGDPVTLDKAAACDLDANTYTLEPYTTGAAAAKTFDQVAIWQTNKLTGAKTIAGTYVVVTSPVSADAAFVNGSQITYLNSGITTYTGTVTAKSVVKAADAAKCGDVFVGGDVPAYVDANGVVYVESASGTIYNVGGKAVSLAVATEEAKTVAELAAMNGVYTDGTVYTVVHTYAADTKTVGTKTEITKVYCSVCKAEFAFLEGTVAEAVAKFGAGNYDVKTLAQKTVYVAKTAGAVVAPEAGDKVESAETFDAGIAMYVGMSVMAAAGSAVVLKKKD